MVAGDDISTDLFWLVNVADPSASVHNAEHVAEIFSPSYVVKNKPLVYVLLFIYIHFKVQRHD